MNRASKHLDIVFGIDIHIVQPTGPVPPVPMPNPFVGIVMDPNDYGIPMSPRQITGLGKNLAKKAFGKVGQLAGQVAMQQLMGRAQAMIMNAVGMGGGGATVKVNGLYRNIAGTQGLNIPFHFPIGGPFVMKVENECETFMGSYTVSADSDRFAFSGVHVLSCHCIAPPGPLYFGKLPTSAIISIPLSPPVYVGGPPVPSLKVFLNKLLAAAMARGLSALQAKMCRSGISARARAKLNSLMNRLGITNKGFRNFMQGFRRSLTGDPVDVATGAVISSGVDVELPGPIPFKWERNYHSSSTYDGPMGYGWNHPYDMALTFDEDDELVAIRLQDGRIVAFPSIAIGEQSIDKSEQLILLRDEQGYYLRNLRDRYFYRFTDTPIKGENVFPLSTIETITGFKISLVYNDKAALRQITDSAGRILPVETNDKGRIMAIFGPHPDRKGDVVQLVSYDYDESGNLIEVKDALGHPFRYSYKNHLMSSRTLRTGLNFYFEYDGDDNYAYCVHTWGDGGIYDHKLTYYKESKYTAVEDSLGHKKVYYHNDIGLVYKTVFEDGSTEVKHFGPDAELLAEINEMGEITRYGYDQFGNTNLIISPDGTSVQFEYDKNGLQISSIDEVGNESFWKYNDHEQLVKRIDPSGNIWFYKYKNRLLHEIASENKSVRNFIFDSNFQLTKVTDNNGQGNSWKYDLLGRCISTIDSLGNKQNRAFDLKGQLTSFIDANNVLQEYSYDSEGNVIKIRDKDSSISYQYSGFNKIKSRIQGGNKVTYNYDSEERICEIENEAGTLYKFELNSKGMVIAESGFNNVKTSYQRDTYGRITTVIHPNGLKTSYFYNLRGQVELVVYPDGDKVNFVYREDGHLTEAINTNHVVRFERDLLGRILKEECDGFAIKYTYNTNGLKQSTSSTLGAEILFEWDEIGNIKNVNSKGSTLPWETEFIRDQMGREIAKLMPGNVKNMWQRDSLGRPISQKVKVNDKILLSHRYLWGHDSKLNSITDSSKGTTRFEHDSTGNLIKALYYDGKEELKINDPVGNIYREKNLSDRSYGKSGEILTMGKNEYEYDTEGNLVRKFDRKTGKWTYQWNSAGMLTTVIRPNGEKISFTYDALGRRMSKTYLGKTTKWLWDGDVIIHEWSCDAKRKDRSIAGEISEKPYYNELITWIFEPYTFVPLAKLSNDGNYSVVTDHLGTPKSMYDVSGKVVWKGDLSIYGVIRETDRNKAILPFRFQGQYEDKETGLYYNRFRYYDPEVGTYISQDPIGLMGGFALYSYVPDTNSFIDPLGLSTCIDDAARKVLERANRLSIKHNREFGGLIYEINGRYYATPPLPGSKAKAKPASASLPHVPEGAKVVGDYHTHGDYSRSNSTRKGKERIARTDQEGDQFDSDNFSDADKNFNRAANSQNPGHVSYLGTPSGKFKKLENGETTEL